MQNRWFQSWRGQDALVAEQEDGDRRDGDRHTEGGDDLDERGGLAHHPEQEPVEQQPEPRTDHEQRDGGGRQDAPVLLGVQEVVEAGHEVGDGAEREIEDAGRQVGDDQSGRRDGVDGAKGETGDDVLKH